MSEKPKYDPPSQTFEDAFKDGVGGCVTLCFCGRWCYDVANTYDWENGELETLQKDPNAVPLDYSVGTLTVEGKSFVMGCPCNGARPYQNFIDRHARKIATYLNLRVKEMVEEAAGMAVGVRLEAEFPHTVDLVQEIAVAAHKIFEGDT